MSKRASQLLRIVLLFPGLFLFALCLWTTKFFGEVTLDQIISTVQFDLAGAFSADSIFIKRFFVWCVFWPFVTALILSFSTWRLYRVIFLLGVLVSGWHYSIFASLSAVVRADYQQDYFKSHYVDPKAITFHTTHPKSLVLIYVESLENTYSNPRLFGHDLLQKLHALKVNQISFNHEQQMPGTGWTMAGIVSTQCGIPLKLATIFTGNRIGENINHFLPNVMCLPDILAEQGYRNVHLDASSLRFAGGGKFFATHHYHEIIGKEEWLAKGMKANVTGWGLADDALFREAKIKLAELINAKKLFSLSLLTINTHGPSGHLNQTCSKQGFKQFTGVVECTAGEVADFINFVAAKGWLEKVNIVIVGDHLAMQNDVYDKLQKAPSRTIYNVLISQKRFTKYTDEVVHFDFLPTILDSLGFSYPEGRLGLGVSALRKNTQPSHFAEMEKGIQAYSATYNQFWLKKSENDHPGDNIH